MKKILLFPRKKQIYALVDDADFDRLNQFRWYAMEKRGYGVMAYRYRENEYGITYRALHVEVLEHVPRGRVVDHINHDILDCRRKNLRICTHQQNLWNRGPIKGRKYSRYKNVYFITATKNGVKSAVPRPWFARVEVNDKRHNRGPFADEREAYQAAKELMQQLHGEFACTEPWRGYSDTPALTEALGKKNGLPKLTLNEPRP